jgi:preprotein translocase subunit YajC
VEQYFPFILLALAVLLLFVLPARQRKRMQAQTQAMQDSLDIGTPVMTTSGMHASVAAIGDTTIDLEIAPGVVVTFARQAVLEIRKPLGSTSEGTPDDGTDTGTPGTAGGRPAAGTL